MHKTTKENLITDEAQQNKVLIVENLKKTYTLPDHRKVKVLDGISFTLRKGEFLVLLGPNGCGKSTLTKIITGIETPDDGKVYVPRGTKSIGYAPQRDILLPWKSILDNITFALKVRKKEVDVEKLKALLTELDLGDFINAYPYQLSVGMRQKINVIRAFLMAEDWLVLDEPFSAVDVNMRMVLNRFAVELVVSTASKTAFSSLQGVLEEEFLRKYYALPLSRDLGVLYITHSVDEAIMVASRVLILSPKPTKVVEEIEIRFEEDGKPIYDPIKRKSHPKFSEYFTLLWDKVEKVFGGKKT